MSEDTETQVVNDSAAQDAAPAEAQVAESEYVKKLRAEAAQYRTRLRELEAKVREDENAKLTEQERLQRRLAELEIAAAEKERILQERTVEYETKLKAASMGIVDPDAAWRLLDLAELEFDETGRPSNLEAALQKLIKAKPYLVQTSQYAMTNPSRSQSTQTSFTRAQLRDPKFFSEHRAEIMRAMQEGRIYD